jgi:hypothetical protein
MPGGQPVLVFQMTDQDVEILVLRHDMDVSVLIGFLCLPDTPGKDQIERVLATATGFDQCDLSGVLKKFMHERHRQVLVLLA